MTCAVQTQDQVLAEMGLTFSQYDQIISSLYQTALDPTCLGEALRLVRLLFKANYVTLILRGVNEPELVPMIVSGEVAGVGDPNGKVSYLTYAQESAPFHGLSPDQVFTIDDLMSESEWARSSYYLMFCHPFNVFHTLGVNVATADGSLLRFRISRPQGAPNFSKAERTLCEMLVPHLRRAMHVSAVFDRTESLGSLYSQAMGRLSVATMVLDESGTVLELNPVAREILDSNDGLKMVGGRLEATYPSDNRELQRVLRGVVARQSSIASTEQGAEVMSISRPSGQVSFGLVVESIPSNDLSEGKNKPAAVIYIRDAVGKSLASNVVTKQLFNLTPAETALSLELANGLSLEEAAEELNIRRNTARAHLRSIFSKTGVRRQTELVRIMLNSVVALGCPQTLNGEEENPRPARRFNVV